jgi:hypothetical protein
LLDLEALDAKPNGGHPRMVRVIVHNEQTRQTGTHFRTKPRPGAGIHGVVSAPCLCRIEQELCPNERYVTWCRMLDYSRVSVLEFATNVSGAFHVCIKALQR